MTLIELYESGVQTLLSAKIENPEIDVDWIIEHFAHKNTADRILSPNQSLSLEIEKKIQAAINRRLTGEPLAYILGEKEFFGITFLVSPDVLIPRPETELLAELAIEQCQLIQASKPDHVVHILDMGTGSGCLGLTILKHTKNTLLTTLDISPAAIKVAQGNAERLALQDRIRFIEGNACHLEKYISSDTAPFDIVVANPPYIAEDDPNIEHHVEKFEPHLALFSDENGLSHISQWLKCLPSILKPTAFVGFEIGSNQSQTVLNLFDCLGVFSKSYLLKDYSGHNRFVCGEKS